MHSFPLFMARMYETEWFRSVHIPIHGCKQRGIGLGKNRQQLHLHGLTKKKKASIGLLQCNYYNLICRNHKDNYLHLLYHRRTSYTIKEKSCHLIKCRIPQNSQCPSNKSIPNLVSFSFQAGMLVFQISNRGNRSPQFVASLTSLGAYGAS